MPEDDSTASDPSVASDDLPHDDPIALYDAPAVLLRGGDQLGDLRFSLSYIPTSGAAFLKLRAELVLKQFSPSKTPMHLFIRPERIRCLSLRQDSDEYERIASEKLSSDVHVLCLELDRPATLVGPDVAAWTPKNSASGAVLDALRATAQVTSLCICIPRRLVPTAQLLKLCVAATSRPGLESIPRQGETAGLYRGRNGKEFIPCPQSVTAAPPPAYDGFDSSPPSPPVYADPTYHPFKKRRLSNSPDPSASPSPTVLADTIRKITDEIKADVRTEMKTDFKAEVKAELKAELRSELRAEMKSEWEGQLKTELERLESGIMQRVEDRLDSFNSDVDRTLSHYEEEVREHVEVTMDERLDGEHDGLREELEALVRDEIEAAQTNIISRLESSASLTLSFNI